MTAQEAGSLPVLREEVEAAVSSLKAEESPGMDNIPSESFKNGGEARTNSPDNDMPEDQGDKEISYSLVVSLPNSQNA